MASGNKKFGQRIKELREQQRLTQEELAEKVELDYQTISRIETGYYFTSYENLEKIAKALNTSVSELFNYSHLKSKKDLLPIITQQLEKMDETDIRKVYKFIFDYIIS